MFNRMENRVTRTLLKQWDDSVLKYIFQVEISDESYFIATVVSFTFSKVMNDK